MQVTFIRGRSVPWLDTLRLCRQAGPAPRSQPFRPHGTRSSCCDQGPAFEDLVIDSGISWDDIRQHTKYGYEDHLEKTGSPFLPSTAVPLDLAACMLGSTTTGCEQDLIEQQQDRNGRGE